MALVDGLDEVDYTLTIPDGAAVSDLPQYASLSSALKRVKTLAEEERERRRRRRMQLAGDVAMPVFGLDADTGDAKVEDDAIAGGISLAIGSEAHETYVRTRRGMDRFELERANLAEIGFGTKEDFEAPGADEFHEERSEALGAQEGDIAEREASHDELKAPAKVERVQRRMRKGIEAADIQAFARIRAGATATAADDRFVERALPGIMERFVENDAVHSLDGERSRTEAVLEHISSKADDEMQPNL